MNQLQERVWKLTQRQIIRMTNNRGLKFCMDPRLRLILVNVIKWDQLLESRLASLWVKIKDNFPLAWIKWLYSSVSEVNK